MLLIPAIDLYKGKVVRFVKGDHSSSKIYSNAPLWVAKKWQDQGAKFLHIVDLSSALGEGDNADIIREILKEIKIKVEVGGGIRDLDKASVLISEGAERIVVGTKALDDNFLIEAIERLGKERVAVSVDTLASSLAVEGWRKVTAYNSLEFIAHLKKIGLKWVIYTDISRDGTLKGPNYEEIEKLSSLQDMNIIFSGGLSSLGDLKKISKEAPFLKGVILGKALYEAKIDFKAAAVLLQ